MKSRKQLTYTFLLIIGVLVLVNILANTLYLRLDFTEDRRYTLSKATKNILKELKEPITITAYISNDELPAEYMKQRTDIKEMLIEYANLSHGRVRYTFVDPSANEDAKQKAMQAGIPQKPIQVREKDQYKIQQIFFGAVLQLNDKTEVLPELKPGLPLEYAFSATIKKLSATDKPYIGLLQGQGEPSPSAINQAYSTLQVLYNVEPVYLSDTSYTLKKYKTIAIIGAKDTIREKYLQQLDRYMSEGGNIFIAFSHVDANSQNASGIVVNNGISNWLKKKGLILGDNFVIDANCGSVTAQQQQGGFIINTPVKFPYFPVISNFPKHPITDGLDAVILPFASSLTYKGDSSKIFVPLIQTSEKSGTQPAPLRFDLSKEWNDADFPLKNVTMAGVLVPKSGNGNKILVVTNGNFATNGETQQQEQQQQVNPGNLNLMVNSIDWLSDETGLIELRAKGIKFRPLDKIDDGKRTFLKYLNFLLPILLIIGYGIYRMNNNRNKRVKRMEAHYV
jgi:gliding-associated putative ABC transporter substrate-binding component GldG